MSMKVFGVSKPKVNPPMDQRTSVMLVLGLCVRGFLKSEQCRATR